MNGARIVHVTTVPLTFGFLTGQISYMQKRGFDVVAISSRGPLLDRLSHTHGCATHAVAMPRRITPFTDAVAVARLYRLFRSLRPDIVHAHTPKAGMLATIAAWLARVPVRVFQIHGLPHVAWTGWKRRLLQVCTRIPCALATQVIAVSDSMRTIAVEEGLCESSKCILLHNGSSHGVNSTATFNPDRYSDADREALRQSWGIPAGATVIGFVGRLVRDKGVEELAAALRVLDKQFPNLHLVIAGTPEPQDPMSPSTLEYLREHPRVHMLGWIDNTASLYAGIDCLVLPSYREGYPNVVLEASAMALPVVTTQIPGCADAVVDGHTGTLVPPLDHAALATAIAMYADDPGLRRRHGGAGRERVTTDYQPEDLWRSVYDEYVRLCSGVHCSVAMLRTQQSR